MPNLMELEDHHCRYIVGDDCYCGKDIKKHSRFSFCEEHHEICFRQKRKKVEIVEFGFNGWRPLKAAEASRRVRGIG